MTLLTDSVILHAPVGLKITWLSTCFFGRVIAKMYLTLFLSAPTY